MNGQMPLIRRNGRWHGGARKFFLDRLAFELRKTAQQPHGRVLSMADADELRRRLGTRYVQLSVSEGQLFSTDWWERAPKGWQLRTRRREVHA